MADHGFQVLLAARSPELEAALGRQRAPWTLTAGGGGCWLGVLAPALLADALAGDPALLEKAALLLRHGDAGVVIIAAARGAPAPAATRRLDAQAGLTTPEVLAVAARARTRPVERADLVAHVLDNRAQRRGAATLLAVTELPREGRLSPAEVLARHGVRARLVADLSPRLLRSAAAIIDRTIGRAAAVRVHSLLRRALARGPWSI